MRPGKCRGAQGIKRNQGESRGIRGSQTFNIVMEKGHFRICLALLRPNTIKLLFFLCKSECVLLDNILFLQPGMHLPSIILI